MLLQIANNSFHLRRDEETSPTHENRRRAAFGDVSDDDDIPPMMEDGEPVEVEEEAPRINVDIPRCVAEIGSEPFFVKLPNFLSVDTRCVCACAFIIRTTLLWIA